MYPKGKLVQVEFEHFNQASGLPLARRNKYVMLAEKIDWEKCDEMYAASFKSRRGRTAFPVRMALGALIIQKAEGLSDRKLVEKIAENPYYQYFIGLPKFTTECPFEHNTVVRFRARINIDFIKKINEIFLMNAECTKEHAMVQEAENSEAKKEEIGNQDDGTLILDATCSPSNIRYPQDFSLLNQARENLERIIDYLCDQQKSFKKPRTYRRIARKLYLTLAKKKKRTAKEVRAFIRKHLGFVRRDIEYVDRMLKKGGILKNVDITLLKTIRKLYEQQKEMFDKKIHRIEKRIVSISQPWIRPIMRGKAKAPVEFGAKYDVSVDEKGHARIEKVNFEPYNEGKILTDVLEKYKERTGHYPKRVLVDQIYRTRENRKFCKDNGIRISGPKLGKARKGNEETDKKIESKDNRDRIEVERFFGYAKGFCGAALIRTKLEKTTLASIAMSVFVANLLGVTRGSFFYVIFLDDGLNYGTRSIIEFKEAI